MTDIGASRTTGAKTYYLKLIGTIKAKASLNFRMSKTI